MTQARTTIVSKVTPFSGLCDKIEGSLQAIESQYAGTSFPTSPAPQIGRPCFRTDRGDDGLEYVYTGNPALGEGGWVERGLLSSLALELIAARGTKSTLDQRFDVAFNEDGTLKASTSLNPSQWHLPSLTFAYYNATIFTATGDQTDIYKATRRLKINLAATTVYSEVVSAAYSAGPDTTSVVIAHSVLDSGLVSVEHSLFLPAANEGALTYDMLAGARYVTQTLSGDYTLTVPEISVVCFLNPNGANRNLILSGTPKSGAIIDVLNTGSAFNVLFNSNDPVAPGQSATFAYNGTAWKRYSKNDLPSGMFAGHAAATPDMTVVVDPGSLIASQALVSKAQQISATITAPVANPRIDLVSISVVTGVLAITTGTEAATPACPAIPANSWPIASVYLIVGQTTILNAHITDLRSFLAPQLSLGNSTKTEAYTLTAADFGRFLTANSASAFAFLLPTITGMPTFLPVRIKNINTGLVTLTGTIDGTVNPVLAQHDEISLYSDGTSWRGKIKAQQVPLAQCRFDYSSATACLLTPQGGNQIAIAGVNYTIPAAGVSFSNSGLSASTLYYAYVYLAAGVLTGYWSATAPSVDPVTGMPYVTNNGYTCVGMAITNASSQFQADSVYLNGVASYWNKREKSLSKPFTADREVTVTSSTWVEFHSEARVSFLNWANDNVCLSAHGGQRHNEGLLGYVSFGLDSATVPVDVASLWGEADSTYPMDLTYDSRPSQGAHYATLLAGSSGTQEVKVLGGATSGKRTTLSVKVWG